MDERWDDIEKYKQGKLTPAERHALEKAALDDPFLSDALEGASTLSTNEFSEDLQEIKSKLQSSKKIVSPLQWTLGIAASLILLIVSGVFIYQYTTDNPLEQRDMALQQKVRSADSVIQEKQELEARQPETETPKVSDNKPTATPLVAPAEIQNLDEEETVSKVTSEDTAPAGISKSDNDEIFSQGAAAVPPPQEQLESPSPALQETKKESVRSESVSGYGARKASRRIVRGKITSKEDGDALPGAEISVKDKKESTVTDDKGNYEISVESPADKLVANFVGYDTKEIAVGEKSEIDIQLSSPLPTLGEELVIGDNKNAENLSVPQPVGGKNAFEKYLNDNLKYPMEALRNKIEGFVNLSFTIESDGKPTGFEVIKGIGFGCDEELIRLIKAGPSWMPAKKNDQAVPEKITLQYKFRLP